MMIKRWEIVFCILSSLLISACTTEKSPDAEPILVLSASNGLGEVPLEVVFRLELKNAQGKEYFCREQFWDFGEGIEELATLICPPYSQDAQLPVAFEKNHTYVNAGKFTVKVRTAGLFSNAIMITARQRSGSWVEFCTYDSECGTGGCSGEICGFKDKVAGIMTTCVYLPEYDCFKETSCACVEGGCEWVKNKAYLDCLDSFRVDRSENDSMENDFIV